MAIIEQLLAEKSEAELEQMTRAITQELNTLSFDLQRINRILAEKRSAREAQARSPATTLRQRIIDLLEISNGPLAPKEIARYLREQGAPAVAGPRLYNLLSRMVRDGSLTRENGLYQLPPPEFASETAENGNGGSLSTAPSTPEAT